MNVTSTSPSFTTTPASATMPHIDKKLTGSPRMAWPQTAPTMPKGHRAQDDRWLDVAPERDGQHRKKPTNIAAPNPCARPSIDSSKSAWSPFQRIGQPVELRQQLGQERGLQIVQHLAARRNGLIDFSLDVDRPIAVHAG